MSELEKSKLFKDQNLITQSLLKSTRMIREFWARVTRKLSKGTENKKMRSKTQMSIWSIENDFVLSRRILRSLRFLFPFLPFGTLLQNFLLLFGGHGFESTHGHFGCGVINLQYFGSRTHFVSSNYHHVDKFVFCLNYFFVTC